MNAGRHGEGDPVISLFFGLCGYPGALESSLELFVWKNVTIRAKPFVLCGTIQNKGSGPYGCDAWASSSIRPADILDAKYIQLFRLMP